LPNNSAKNHSIDAAPSRAWTSGIGHESSARSFHAAKVHPLDPRSMRAT
jgi:hypothetical protein